MKNSFFFFDGKKQFNIEKFDTSYTDKFKNKDQVKDKIEKNIAEMTELQEKLYAENKESLLIIFQAMDAGGKDSAIKHVMHGVNPQGIDVYNFKQPSVEELSHDFLWRAMKLTPASGKMCIFNRSYYEEVLIAKVHKLYESENLPDRCKDSNIMEQRYKDIKNFENYLWNNGTRVIKFFLNISKDEQKKRFLDRINDEAKNWKFSEADIKERAYWNDYQKAYEKAINATATVNCPWYVIPADKKWFARFLISEIIVKALKEIDPKYPSLSEEEKKSLDKYRRDLLAD